MTEALGAPDWMTAPATRAVVAALEAAGGPACVRFVGGCVRNTLMGRPVDDIDLATTLTPDQVTAALQAARLKAVPTGVDHGTVTAVAKGRPFEITTLRRDVETDGRRAVVAFTTDWSEDAERRDFRLNALYADPAGRLYDPTGGGLEDARAGRIVFVGDPETRIREDALRILRFFRFLAWYGRGEPDAAGLAACAALRGRLEGLSAERVGAEMTKLLAAEDPRAAMRLMAAQGVLGEMLPQARDLARFEALVGLQRREGFASEPVLRLAAVLPDSSADAATVAATLRLSNADRDRLAAALNPAPPLGAPPDAAETRRLVYRLGGQTVRDRLLLVWAVSADQAGAEAWRAAFERARTWTPPRLPLTGEAVMAAGVAKGPAVGRVLRAVEDWWVERDFPDDPATLDKRLRAAVEDLA